MRVVLSIKAVSPLFFILEVATVDVIECAFNKININASRSELLVMNAAFNEVCNVTKGGESLS